MGASGRAPGCCEEVWLGGSACLFLLPSFCMATGLLTTKQPDPGLHLPPIPNWRPAHPHPPTWPTDEATLIILGLVDQLRDAPAPLDEELEALLLELIADDRALEMLHEVGSSQEQPCSTFDRFREKGWQPSWLGVQDHVCKRELVQSRAHTHSPTCVAAGACKAGQAV